MNVAGNTAGQERFGANAARAAFAWTRKQGFRHGSFFIQTIPHGKTPPQAKKNLRGMAGFDSGGRAFFIPRPHDVPAARLRRAKEPVSA